MKLKCKDKEGTPGSDKSTGINMKKNLVLRLLSLAGMIREWVGMEKLRFALKS